MIEFVIGDATNPQGPGIKVISHICNDVCAWGAGFVIALSKKWIQPEVEYRKWFREEGVPTEKVDYVNDTKFRLGNVQFVKVEHEIWVANMIGQRSIRSKEGIPPIRYESVLECLEKVKLFAQHYEASVHLPRIGTGLAGGRWDKIEEIIDHSLLRHGIETTVYDLPDYR